MIYIIVTPDMDVSWTDNKEEAMKMTDADSVVIGVEALPTSVITQYMDADDDGIEVGRL